MNPVDVGLGALALTVFLLLIRTPIAAALGVSATIGTFIVFAWRPGAEFSFSAAVRPTMSLLANAPFSFITNFSLATVPLFILMGHLAHEAGFTKIFMRPLACGWRACVAVLPWPLWSDAVDFPPSPDLRSPAQRQWGVSRCLRC